MSNSEWKTYRLGEAVLSANTGLDAIKRAPIVKEDTGIKCLRIQDISQEKTFPNWGFCDVNEINYHKFQLKKDDLIIARTGETVGVNRLIKENLKAVFNNGLIRIRVDENKLNPLFLYYSFQSSIFRNHINSIARGTSTQPNMRIEALLDYNIEIPDHKTQQRIASILSSLDEAIELNQQINKTLEEMAKAIFKEWFVYFNYPNATSIFQETEIGKIPYGWEVGKLNEVLEIKYGKDHKHLESGEIPVYGSGGIMRYADKALYKFESILIPRKGTLSNLFYINKPFWSVDTMFYTKFKLANSGKYLFHLLQSLNLATLNVGSAVPSLTTEVLNNILIAIPTKEVLLKFEEVVSSLFEQIEQNIVENQSLINLRDNLLPKLMKREININL